MTATVDIVPLIASSIMSKKLAEGAEAIVLDVKVGDGAFMKTLDDARVLAEAMLELGRRAGKRGRRACSPTWTSRSAARSATRSRSARRSTPCAATGPADFTELVLDACARLLAYSDLGIDVEEGRRRAEAAVADGSALASTSAGSARRAATPIPARSQQAPVRAPVPAPRDGVVDAARCARGRHRRARARRRPAHEGRRDRPRGRRPLLREARRHRARG